jgi:glycosyltransferase involved in cell wall biosynthesis
VSRLRVLHVIEAMHQGGAESMVVEHVRHAGADVESFVVALNRGGPALEAAAEAGGHVRVLAKGARRLDGLRALARILREERIDVVNGHNPTGALYATGASWRRDLVRVRTEHSFHFAGRHSALYPWLEPLATALQHRVICVCEAVRESHARRFPWAAERFVTVRNGISPAPAARPRAEMRAELGLGAMDPVALTIGSLTPQKAQHDLLEAFAECARRAPRAHLLVAGEGPLRAELEARREALGLAGKVTLLGARNDVTDLLEAAEVFVLSSVREGLSITLLEAMRAARPAVVTRVGGSAEAAVEDETARLVAAGNPTALAAALSGLLEDPAARARLGAGARARWERHFTAERMVRETEGLYRQALHERSGRSRDRAAADPARGAGPVSEIAKGGKPE